MALIVYALCTATAFFCTLLLARAYARNQTRLLLWSSACFAGLTLSNFLVIVDILILPEMDLYIFRTIAALAGVGALLIGMVWEGRP